MGIIIDVFLTVAGLLFTIAVVTRYRTYDTNNKTLDRILVSALWFYVFIYNLNDIINYFKM